MRHGAAPEKGEQCGKGEGASGQRQATLSSGKQFLSTPIEWVLSTPRKVGLLFACLTLRPLALGPQELQNRNAPWNSTHTWGAPSLFLPKEKSEDHIAQIQGSSESHGVPGQSHLVEKLQWEGSLISHSPLTPVDAEENTVILSWALPGGTEPPGVQPSQGGGSGRGDRTDRTEETT